VVTECFVGNAGAPLCIVLTLEIVISGWEDGKIRAFRSDNGELLWFIDNAHRGGVTDLVMSSN
jgi:WD40 repeat protein